MRERCPVDRHHVDAVLGQLAGQRVDALAEDGREALAARERRGLLAGGDAHQRGLRELAVQVLGDDENVAHAQITFASLCSSWTSSWTDLTLRPPVRLGGVSSFRILRRGATSMPRSATGISFISFFRAFMMPGSEA